MSWPTAVALCVLIGASATGAAASRTEIKVALFEKPCLLSGPHSRETLEAVHDLGPERVPPSPSLETAKAALDRINRTGTIFPAAQRYLEKLESRLTAQAEFLKELEIARKNGKSAALLTIARKHLVTKDTADFERRFRKLASSKALKSGDAEKVDAIVELFNDSIEAHPEEEFHRALRSAEIRYDCQFHAGDE